MYYRLQVEHYVEQHPDFGSSLKPLPADELEARFHRGELTAAGPSADVEPTARPLLQSR